MALHAKVDQDVPVPDQDELNPEEDLIKKTAAAASAARLLAEHGLDIETAEFDDVQVAAALATEYAKDPETTSAAATPARIAQMRPAELQLVSEILTRFGHSIVDSSVQVRHMVTNKLIQETENPDPRIRIRALELLGKITDVGLFSEKSEVTVTHQTTDDLRNRLRQKLQKLKDVTPVDDAEVLDG